MKSMISKIDHSLKRLYHLDFDYRAEDFLLTQPYSTGTAVGSNAQTEFRGALYLVTKSPDDLDLGIYLNASVRDVLTELNPRTARRWTFRQLRAFTIATEEISHFLYVLKNSLQGRAVSQLELEIQAEVDKFVILYFAQVGGIFPNDARKIYDRLFARCFEQFGFAEGLSDEARERYRTANAVAKRFLLRLGPGLTDRKSCEFTLRLLRRFYALSCAEKISAA